jgi:Peptidase family M1 domain
MGSNQGLQILGKVSLKAYFYLSCIFFLVGCANPNPVIREVPVATPEPGSSTSLPTEILATPHRITPDPTSLQTSLATSSPQFTPKAGNPVSTEVMDAATQYDLDAILDYFQHSLTVTETIKYVNNNLEALDDLILVVESNRRPGAFSLVSLVWESGGSSIDYDLSGDRLHISLPQPLASGDGVSIVIKYGLEIPEITPPSGTNRPLVYGYTNRQTNIVDWYPYIPPYRSGDGWLVHENWWFGEHQVFDSADFQVKFRISEPVRDLVIAASAPATQDGEAYIYHLDSARTFALSASNQYEVQSTTVGDVTIYSYSFPLNKDAGLEALQNTADALQLFSQLIMPYPHSSLSVVEADFLDGMEFDGLYFLSHGFYDLYDGTPKGYLTFIAAHETAHQWWYGLVGNDQAMEPWLDEAMCTYMEHVFYEAVYADYRTDSGQSLVDWWWYYRVNYYEPDGWVNGSIYDFDQFRSYRDTVYLNGAKFLEDLRNLIGDQAFFSFLKDYAGQNKYQIATATDFFDTLKENTSKNLSGLITQYFQTAK